MTTINIVQSPLEKAGERIAEIAGEAGCGNNIFIVHDRAVASIAGQLGLSAKGVLPIEATEASKTLGTVQEIDRWLMDLGANRDAFLLGIGGGITTDMVGFAASVYKRGIKFAFLPTTLLSQVDAAIGGKNGVNLDSYKNMIGAIRQPEVTVICPEVLETLPYSQIVSGAAELLKTFIIDNSKGLYQEAVELLKALGCSSDKARFIKDHGTELQKLIAGAAWIKAGIAGRDPEEHGERRLLNLGHTFAHAIEKLSEEAIGHGAAVSMGMILAARLSERLGKAEEGLSARLEEDFRACGMPVESPFSVESMAEVMNKDKKAQGGLVHFVLPLRIGKTATCQMGTAEAIEALRHCK